MSDPIVNSLSLAKMQAEATGSSQVLVFLKPGTNLSVADVGQQMGSYFRLSETSQTSALASAGRGRSGKPPVPYRVFPRLGVMLGTVDRGGIEALEGELAAGVVADVQAAPSLRLIRPKFTTASKAPTAQASWGARSLKVPALWKNGLTGKGVVVAHIDTGVDGDHPALKTAIQAFAEFDEMGDKIEPNPQTWDSGEHGTHTAATILGRAVKGKQVGIAHEAMLASALVIEGGNAQARVLGGLEWALDQGVKVLSMSLGFQGYVSSFMQVIQVLRANGILPVVAVGNEGPGTSRSPGNYVESLSVGACDITGMVADFSSSQIFARSQDSLVPDLIGPGVDIVSAKPGGGYQKMSGTSMATPHIAGLAALLFQAKPDATVDEVEAAIFGSCSPLLPQAANLTARGLPNAVRALKLLLG